MAVLKRLLYVKKTACLAHSEAPQGASEQAVGSRKFKKPAISPVVVLFPASKSLQETDQVMDDVLVIEWGNKLSKEFDDVSIT